MNNTVFTWGEAATGFAFGVVGMWLFWLIMEATR
jgi:hypothetical protein